MEGVGRRARARLGVGRWFAAAEGVPSVLWLAGLLKEKFESSGIRMLQPPSHTPRRWLSFEGCVTLSQLEPSEVWTPEGSRVLVGGLPASLPPLFPLGWSLQ